MKKLIIILVLSILSVILFIAFCYNKMVTAAFITAVPTIIINGYVIYIACCKDLDDLD